MVLILLVYNVANQRAASVVMWWLPRQLHGVLGYVWCCERSLWSTWYLWKIQDCHGACCQNDGLYWNSICTIANTLNQCAHALAHCLQLYWRHQKNLGRQIAQVFYNGLGRCLIVKSIRKGVFVIFWIHAPNVIIINTGKILIKSQCLDI